MNPAREEVLLALALEKPAEKRAAFLDAMCEGDAPLRARLEALLAAHEQRDALLATQAETARPTIKLDLADAPDEAVGQTLGRYKLLERVGEGGCGVVYVAEQTEPVRRRVALKVIKLGMDTRQVVARFEAERQALAMMDHPNIAKVLDAGVTGLGSSEFRVPSSEFKTGRPYFVMELVRGIRITDYCDQAKLSTKERLDLFIKVCQAIQHAHQKGIIHRDIKPSNILVTLHDGVPVPKVIDFGIAKATEGRLTDATVYTQLHQFIGTPAYRSPEQAEMSGLDIDTRSDIYGPGVLLYELLTGTTPFDGKELMSMGLDAMRKTIREKEPARPSTKLATLQDEEPTTTAKRRSVDASKLLHQLKGDLDWIVMRCLEEDRTRRYETANGLAMDLKRHLNHEPVVARPPSAVYRFRKLVRRNKIVFAGIAAVAAALVIGAMVSTWLAIRATRAEHEQNRLRKQAQEGERVAQHNLARQYLRRGQSLCEQGDVTRGLHWLARAHKEAPAQSAPLKDSIRENLAAWAERWKPANAVLLHDSLVMRAGFSPDGRCVATGNHDGVGQSWSTLTGERLSAAIKHEEYISMILFSPDGKRLFTASADQTIRLWDARTGEPICSPIRQTNGVTSAAFSPDGSRVVTGANNGTVQSWDSATGQAVGAHKEHAGNVTAIAFSPEGNRLLTASEDQTARLWDGRNGEPLNQTLRHTTGVHQGVFSRDGKRIATACADNMVRLWNAQTGEPIGSPMLHPEVDAVTFSPDGEHLLSWGGDLAARLWAGASGELVGKPLRHEKRINAAAFSADGSKVLTAGNDGRLRLWSAQTSAPLGPALHYDHDSDQSPILATSNGWHVAGGMGDAFTLRFIPSDSRDQPNATPAVAGTTVTFASDGRRLLHPEGRSNLPRHRTKPSARPPGATSCSSPPARAAAGSFQRRPAPGQAMVTPALTRILDRAQQGDPRAAEALLPLRRRASFRPDSVPAPGCGRN